jgi:hypothetical protein
VTLPTNTQLHDQATDGGLLPSWLRDDPLVDVLVWGLAAALGVQRDRAAALLLRLDAATAETRWLDLLLRERGTARLQGETDASAAPRAKLKPRGVTPGGIASELTLLLRTGQRLWVVEADAGPLGASCYCSDDGTAATDSRETYCDRPMAIVDDSPWHRLWVLVEEPPVVQREVAYCDREDFYCDRAVGDGWCDTDPGDPDENVLRAIALAVPRLRLAGVRGTVRILPNPYTDWAA